MEKIASEEKIDFIMNTGDNYYDPKGTSNLKLTNWSEKWEKIYNTGLPNLQQLPWYGVLGNHDYNYKKLNDLFLHKENGWQIKNYFWSHIEKVDGKNVAFIHIDTSFIAYGIEGEPNNKYMNYKFKGMQWSYDKIN